MKYIFFCLFCILVFGCSTAESEKKDKSGSTEEILESVEAFMNRPIHKVLTEEIIDTTSDENLVVVIYDNLIEKMPKDFSKYFETVSSWNKARRAIFLICILDAEVNNGGFNQFYFNFGTDYNPYLVEAYRTVQSSKIADLIEKTNKLYETEYDKITEQQDGTLEGFSKSYENNPLTAIDSEYYELTTEINVGKLMIDFIRKNKSEFIDK